MIASGNLQDLANTQPARRHVAASDVMAVARGWVGNPGNVLVASH